jgi:hypothetical protein
MKMGRRPLPEGTLRVNRSKGYIDEKRSGHPLARPSGWVAQHRMVLFDSIGEGPHACDWCEAEVWWGRNLHADHLDHDRGHNAPMNLVPACDRCNSRRWKADAANGTGRGVEE